MSTTGKLNNSSNSTDYSSKRSQLAADPADSRGFTLLELIVVCTLIGVMLSISVPSLRNAFFTNPLKASARKLVGTINEVRQKAVRSQEPYHLHLSQVENRIWYEKAIQPEEESESEEDQTDKKELQLPESVRLAKIWMRQSGVTASGDTTLYISKKGYMEQAAIQLSDDSDKSLTIQCNPFTDPMTVSEEFPPSAL